LLESFHDLWIEARIEVIERWTESLLGHMGTVRLVVPPRAALVMMQASDSVECAPFCLGEVAVTECQLEFDGVLFRGRVIGNDPVRAAGIAVLKAAEERAPWALEPLLESFREETRVLVEQRLTMAKALGTTRVQFETMTPT
jgi:phosphonate C-P lyase system protein PhnG